jgi:hypothetical protein
MKLSEWYHGGLWDLLDVAHWQEASRAVDYAGIVPGQEA